jgi:hypothetical protein
MTMKHITITASLILTLAISIFAQSEKAYDTGSSGPYDAGNGGANAGGANAGGTSANSLSGPVGGLLDPSRFTVNHAVSFAAGGSQMSNLKSQSVYTTMMQYKFNAPVVLSLNFDMPIHSTFNQYQNFTADNLSSMDYFRNMPFDASVSWMPRENLMFRVSVIKMPEAGAGYFYNGYRGFGRPYW